MSIKTTRIIKGIVFILVASLPIIAYSFKFSVLDRNDTFGYDWGYFAQIYEAARLSLLKYHQFPWWNSWSIGGIPLYANPQFGLVSVSMLLVLLFGTVPGLHLSVMIYLIIGFWGMHLLLLRIGCRSKLIATLLAYIWVFSGFISAHMLVGHLTFSAYLISPWVFLTLLNIRKKRGWIWFGFAASYVVLQSPHYIAIEVVVISLVVGAFQILKSLHQRKLTVINTLKPYIKSLLIIIPLVSIKLLFVFQYLHDYPRITSPDSYVPAFLIFSSLAFRGSISTMRTLGAKYGWWEYSDYIGLATLILFVYAIVSRLFRKHASDLVDYLLLGAIFAALLLALGPFSPISPYSLIHKLPIFNEMRIPSRWIGWVSFGIVLFLARLPKKPLVYLILIVSVLDVFSANYRVLNAYQAPYKGPTNYSATIVQYSYYKFDQTPLSALYATQSNIGQIYGYEPILAFGGDYNPTYYSTITKRCGENQGCSFVETHNATVTYWSPLSIVIKRSSTGPILLDMNPGKDWLVNGNRLFEKYRIVEPNKDFIIYNPSRTLHITFSPTL